MILDAYESEGIGGINALGFETHISSLEGLEIDLEEIERKRKEIYPDEEDIYA